MNPKEKATELIEKFKDMVNPYIGSGMLSNTHDDNAILWQSKKCALVVANELLANTPMYEGNLNPRWKFWNDVKSEIESM